MISKLTRKTEAGFTLVELAIVLMIIGLLIGGILRGQELMENARVTSTIQQTKAYDGAVTTFRDAYAALPGDIVSPATRLANCASGTPCSGSAGAGGDGNGIIGTTTLTGDVSTGTYSNAALGENRMFWLQMAATHLISGVNPVANNTVPSWGQEFPAGKIAGGFQVAQVNVASKVVSGVTVPAVNGIFLVLRNGANPGTTPAAAEALGTAAVSALRAAQIDRKLDDGIPQTGDVLGVGLSTNCTGTGNPASYGEISEQRDCNLLIRVQS